MKICPYCESELSDTARKCKFCGEWVHKEKESHNTGKEHDTVKESPEISKKITEIKKDGEQIHFSGNIFDLTMGTPKSIGRNYLPDRGPYNEQKLGNGHILISDNGIHLYEENNCFRRPININEIMGVGDHNGYFHILEISNPAILFKFKTEEISKIYNTLDNLLTVEQIDKNYDTFISEWQTKAINDDFQEFLGRINNFQERCYSKIDAMEKEFNLEHPIIESNTDSSKLFMANGAIIDSENTIKEGHKLLEEFNNFDLNDNGINQCFGFFKLTLESLEETYEKVKMKYGPAISTYKTLRKITSRNAVYKPSEINDNDAANTENNVKVQDNEKDDNNGNSTLTTEIWVILIIIGIIILIALNS